jgi:hypothetical protein
LCELGHESISAYAVDRSIRGADRHHANLGDANTRIDRRLLLDSTHQKAGPDQDDDADGDLNGKENAPQRKPGCGLGVRALERGDDVGSGCVERRRKPESDSRRRAEQQGKPEDQAVWSETEVEGAERLAVPYPPDQERWKSVCNADAQQRCHEREHESLCQQLTDDSATAGAQREADRDLLRPRGGTCELQVPDVRARQQPHEQQGDLDHAEHDEDHAPAGLRQERQSGHEHTSRPRAFSSVKLRQENVGLGRGLLAAGAGAQTSDNPRDTNVGRRTAATQQPVGRSRQNDFRPPSDRRLQANELSRRNADNRERDAVQGNRSTEDCRVRPETGFPQARAEHGNRRRCARPIVVRAQSAAANDRKFERVEEGAAHYQSLCSAQHAAITNLDCRSRSDGSDFQALRPLRQDFVLVEGEHRRLVCGSGWVQRHHVRGVTDARRCVERERVEEREQARVQSRHRRQDPNRHQREAWLTNQAADGVTGVLPEAAQGCQVHLRRMGSFYGPFSQNVRANPAQPGPRAQNGPQLVRELNRPCRRNSALR